MIRLKTGNRLTIVAAILLTGLTAGCSSSVDQVDQEIDVHLIESKTELPSKIRLFFQADLSEFDHLTALDQPDFEIYENGSRISNLESQARIRRESGEFLYSSILLLDLSGSILNNQDLPGLKSAASSFIRSSMPEVGDALHGTREMAVYWFDGRENIRPLVSFTDDRVKVLEAIDSIHEEISDDVSTNLNGALVQGLSTMEARLTQLGSDSDIAIAGSLVLFTDGTDQAARVSTEAALDALDNTGRETAVFTIGLGGEIDEDILSRFGKNGFEPAGDSLELESSFLAIADRLEREANSYYVLEYCSPKRAGDHTLRLVAVYEEMFGAFETTFSAEGFTGGCTID